MLLLVLHALTAVLLLGATTHNALLVVRYPFRGVRRAALERLYVRVQVVAYLATFALGAMLYPSYRVYTRGAVFDHHAPWASNLFDIKENLAALGLPALLAYFALSLRAHPSEHPRWTPLYVGLGLYVALVVWFDFVAGIVVVAMRGVS